MWGISVTSGEAGGVCDWWSKFLLLFQTMVMANGSNSCSQAVLSNFYVLPLHETKHAFIVHACYVIA